MKTSQLKPISATAPYVAVLIGLYALKNAWIAIGLYHCGMAGFIIAADRNNLLQKARTGWNPIVAILGTAMSAMVVPIIYFSWGYVHLPGEPLAAKLATLGLPGTAWILFAIYFSTVQPFLEELYWRGYLGASQKVLSWTDFAFAGYHILVLAWFIKLPWLLIAFLVLTITAYIWRYMASKLEGLALPLLSHAIADVGIVTATYFLAQH